MNRKKRKNPIKISSNSMKVGLPPGFLIDDKNQVQESTIELMIYNRETHSECTITQADLAELSLEEDKEHWINIVGSKDSELLRTLGKRFHLNHLSVEDVQNCEHRPKIDDFTDYIHTNLKMLTWDEQNKVVLSEQINIIWGGNFVISVQERAGDVFDVIRNRIKNKRGRITKEGSAYLSYALIDAIVDNYFVICDRLQEENDALEESAGIDNPKKIFGQIRLLKKELIMLRKSIWPVREILLTIQKGDFELIPESSLKYFKDIYDHSLSIIDMIEQMREILTSLQESLISSISFEMNNVMKVLTIISTIFIPLTFVAGIYGMNFIYMPELAYRWSYFIVLGGMFLLFILMMIFFKKKKWI